MGRTTDSTDSTDITLDGDTGRDLATPVAIIELLLTAAESDIFEARLHLRRSAWTHAANHIHSAGIKIREACDRVDLLKTS